MRTSLLRGGLLAFMFTLLLGIAQAADYKIDNAHSSVAFKLRHMGVSWTKGTFKEMAGTIKYDAAKPEDTVINVTIQVASIDTDNDARDKHLKTADFFDAEKYPTIVFKSTGVTDHKDGTLTVSGDLTMHGVTKPVDLEVTELGPEVYIEEFKTTKRAASAKTKINRLDFDVSTDQMMGMGEMSIGKDVMIEIELELDKV